MCRSISSPCHRSIYLQIKLWNWWTHERKRNGPKDGTLQSSLYHVPRFLFSELIGNGFQCYGLQSAYVCLFLEGRPPQPPPPKKRKIKKTHPNTQNMTHAHAYRMCIRRAVWAPRHSGAATTSSTGSALGPQPAVHPPRTSNGARLERGPGARALRERSGLPVR